MKRLTYKTVGDAFRQPHYCHGPGVKKDDLMQRLGKLEDAFTEIPLVMIAIRNAAEAGETELLRRACSKLDEIVKEAANENNS